MFLILFCTTILKQMYTIIVCFSNPGILGKVREGAENMQQKIQNAKSDGKFMAKERSIISFILLPTSMC